MSLLNDALRKKRSEQQPTDNVLKASLPKLNNKPGRSIRHWQIIASVLVLSAATYGVWFYLNISDATPDFPAGTALAGLEDNQSVDHAEALTKKGAKAVTPTIASVVPATPKAQISKAPKPPTQKEEKPLEPKAQGTLKRKQASARTPSEVKASPVPKKKPDTTAPLKKRPNRKKPRSTKAKAFIGNPAQRTVQSDRLYLKARQYHRQNRIDEAIALYLEVIRIDPEHYKARFNLTAAYLQTKAYTQAYPIIADLYAKEPHNQQVMLNLAIAHIGCRRYPEALDLLNKAAMTADAPLFEIAFHKGVAFNHLNQTPAALEWYKRAEAMSPDNPRLLFNLAVVYDQQAQYRTAAYYYRRYLDQNSEIDILKKKQIRQRLRLLLTYSNINSKETSRDEKTHR